MGLFTEIVLSFDFAERTPDRVLSAFAALGCPDQREGTPPLPAPVAEAWDQWEPAWRDVGYAEGQGDPFEGEPWKHDWASWVSTAMGVQTTPHGLLSWSEMGAWNLDCRFSWKTQPAAASQALEWLAPYVGRQYAGTKVLVGYAQYEIAPRPQLFWVSEDRWEMEDLNPDDEWMWG